MVTIVDGEVLSAQKINDNLNHTLLAPKAYLPSLDGASATASGSYIQIGRLVEVQFDVAFTGAGGTLRVGLPFPVDPVTQSVHRTAIGKALAFQSGTTEARRSLTALVADLSGVMSFLNDATGALITGSVPFTWKSGDSLRGRVSYWKAS